MLPKKKPKLPNPTTPQDIDHALQAKVEAIKLQLHIDAVKQNLPTQAAANGEQIKANSKKALTILKEWNEASGFSLQLRDTIDLAVSGLNLFLQTIFDKKKETH